MSKEIEKYQDQLRDVCGQCNRYSVCKNRDKLCFTKKMVFAIARVEYKRRLKKGLIKE